MMPLDVGLDDTDLDFIQIVIPIHRRVLKAASRAKYSEVLQISVPASRDFGSVIVYKVCSKFKFATSAIHLRYSDFNKFNRFVLSTCFSPDILTLQSEQLDAPGIAWIAIAAKISSAAWQGE